jgi:hypothetical protein
MMLAVPTGPADFGPPQQPVHDPAAPGRLHGQRGGLGVAAAWRCRPCGGLRAGDSDDDHNDDDDDDDQTLESVQCGDDNLDDDDDHVDNMYVH